jgi:hypothetical protein
MTVRPQLAFPNPSDYITFMPDATYCQASSSALHLTDQEGPLRRRQAVRRNMVRPVPQGPRPCPTPKRLSTQNRSSTSSHANRQSIDSTRSFTSVSSVESGASFPMPTTPPFRTRDLPRIQTVPTNQPKSAPARPHSSVRLVHQETPSTRPTPVSAESDYSQYSTQEEYDAERVRLTRLKMAEDLLARRKASRKGSDGSPANSAVSVQSSEWLWDRHFRYQEWQHRQVEAAALERKLTHERERDRAFKEWQWDQRRDKAICGIQRGATRVKGRW